MLGQYENIFYILFRSNAQIKKVDTVHAQDYGEMSASQLTSNLNDNKKRDRKIAAEMQLVLEFKLFNLWMCIRSRNIYQIVIFLDSAAFKFTNFLPFKL